MDLDAVTLTRQALEAQAKAKQPAEPDTACGHEALLACLWVLSVPVIMVEYQDEVHLIELPAFFDQGRARLQ